MGSTYKRTWKDKDGTVHQCDILWIKYYRNGKAYRESSGSAKESDAKRLLRLREGDIARGVPITPKVGRVKFDELADDVVNDYLINGRRSLRQLEIRFRLHLLPFFGGRRAMSPSLNRESSGSAKESDAKRLLRLREGDIARGVPITPKVGRVKFDELADDVVNDYLINGRRSLRQLEIRFRLHLLPFFGGRRAAGITTSDIRKFIAKRQEAGASNATINRELESLKRAFNLGIQAGKLISKLYVPKLKENNVRTGFFEPAQFNAVRGFGYGSFSHCYLLLGRWESGPEGCCEQPTDPNHHYLKGGSNG